VKYRLSNINNIIKEVYMSKEEMRRSRRGSHSAAGYVAKELEEIRKLQETERRADALGYGSRQRRCAHAQPPV